MHFLSNQSVEEVAAAVAVELRRLGSRSQDTLIYRRRFEATLDNADQNSPARCAPQAPAY